MVLGRSVQLFGTARMNRVVERPRRIPCTQITRNNDCCIAVNTKIRTHDFQPLLTPPETSSALSIVIPVSFSLIVAHTNFNYDIIKTYY